MSDLVCVIHFIIEAVHLLSKIISRLKLNHVFFLDKIFIVMTNYKHIVCLYLSINMRLSSLVQAQTSDLRISIFYLDEDEDVKLK